MDFLDRIAERKLAEAIARGELDDYPGKGEPLELEDLSGVPEELRASYILLKGHGVLSEEAELRRELVSIESLLRVCADDGARAGLLRRRTRAAVELALFLERRGSGPALSEFHERIVERLAPSDASADVQPRTER